MQYELLIHSMLIEECRMSDLKGVRDSCAEFSKKSLLSGCMVVHKNEVVHYVSGKKKDVFTALDIMKASKCLTLIRNLHSGTREDDCVGQWDFVSTDEDLADVSREETLSVDEFLPRLAMARGVSIGLQLFSSVSQIILSEKLYSLD